MILLYTIRFRLLQGVVSLLAVDVFGMLKDEPLKLLRGKLSPIQINKYPLSSIARPTTGVRRTSIWGLRVRDCILEQWRK